MLGGGDLSSFKIVLRFHCSQLLLFVLIFFFLAPLQSSILVTLNTRSFVSMLFTRKSLESKVVVSLEFSQLLELIRYDSLNNSIAFGLVNIRAKRNLPAVASKAARVVRQSQPKFA